MSITALNPENFNPQQLRPALSNPTQTEGNIPTEQIPGLKESTAQNSDFNFQDQSGSERNLAPFSHQKHIAMQGYLGINKEGGASLPELPGGDSADKSPNAEVKLPGKNSEEENETKAGEVRAKGTDGQPLSDEEQAKVEDMKARDAEVRTHENQHKAVGGSYAQAPSYTYESGPDGKRYITDGEVSIDIGKENDPQKTIEKMQVVRRAALAPAEPSSADRSVAAEASRLEAEARTELAEEKRDEFGVSGDSSSSSAETDGPFDPADSGLSNSVPQKM